MKQSNTAAIGLILISIINLVLTYLILVFLAWLIILLVPVVGTYVNAWALGAVFIVIKNIF